MMHARGDGGMRLIRRVNQATNGRHLKRASRRNLDVTGTTICISESWYRCRHMLTAHGSI